jgi:hypothetical protein
MAQQYYRYQQYEGVQPCERFAHRKLVIDSQPFLLPPKIPHYQQRSYFAGYRVPWFLHLFNSKTVVRKQAQP